MHVLYQYHASAMHVCVRDVFLIVTGQFFRDGVEVDEVRKILIMPSKEPVPVMRRPVWAFMEREDKDDQLCWTAMNPGYQGEGLIDGKPNNYLVDNVLDDKFMYNDVL